MKFFWQVVLVRRSFLVTQRELDWSKQSSLCKLNLFPLLPTSALFFLWVIQNNPPPSFSTSSFLSISRSLTGSSAVTADVVTRHPLDLSQDGLGQLLYNVVLANMLVTLKGVVERLLLAVLQHWDPSEKRHRVNGKAAVFCCYFRLVIP